MKGFRRSAGWLLPLLLAGLAGPAGGAQETSQEPAATQTVPVAGETGTLSLRLSGNRNFCVKHNEIDFRPGIVKPRQYRNSPLITTFGYKYQISASRRGSNSVIKLMESPTIRTAVMEKKKYQPKPPGPRLAAPGDKKNPSQPLEAPKPVVRWIPGNGCTILEPEFDFPLAPGRYDIYLGFDVMLQNGQWAPVQSDYLTDVIIEKGQVTQVNGRVDYTDGLRVVKIESSEKPRPAEQ